MEISYKGSVTVQLMHGSRPYRTIRKSNVGCTPLFTYIARCLAGYYDITAAPQYIRMFHLADPSDPDPSTMFNVENETCPAVQLANVSLSSDSSSAKANFEFIAPSNMISTSASSNLIALYNTQNRSNRDNPSAYIVLDTTPIIVSGDSNVKILWEMTIENKN